MASRKTLNTENLEALGASRLAELLMEISQGDAAAKRRLRMELASNLSPDEVARDIRKRLNTIARSQSVIDWDKLGETADDLDNQRKGIVKKVAPAAPSDALDLLWQFLGLANGLFERCHDGNGEIIGIFHQACEDLGTIAKQAPDSPEVLADKAFTALRDNDYGQCDHLIRELAPALGNEGLEALKTHFQDWQAQPATTPPEHEREKIGFGIGGAIYKDQLENNAKQRTCSMALQNIADAQGDVDAYVAQYDKTTKTVPRVAAGIATRLLEAGRAQEALAFLDQAQAPRHDLIPDYSLEYARIAALDALGRRDEAQTYRWQCFERTLEGDFLRVYLQNLPDFEDFEAEQQALDYASQHPEFHRALDFLINWPAPEKAADFVTARSSEINGNLYQVVTPAADALEGKYPLAATLLRRAMIDYILENKKSSRYRHAARHLKECESLSHAIDSYDGFETHQDFHERLQRQYGARQSFWSKAA